MSAYIGRVLRTPFLRAGFLTLIHAFTTRLRHPVLAISH